MSVRPPLSLSVDSFPAALRRTCPSHRFFVVLQKFANPSMKCNILILLLSVQFSKLCCFVYLDCSKGKKCFYPFHRKCKCLNKNRVRFILAERLAANNFSYTTHIKRKYVTNKKNAATADIFVQKFRI